LDAFYYQSSFERIELGWNILYSIEGFADANMRLRLIFNTKRFDKNGNEKFNPFYIDEGNTFL
jgi:hypothetical protein